MITGILFVFFTNAPMEVLQSESKFNTIEECQADAENAVQEILTGMSDVAGVEYICGELKG